LGFVFEQLCRRLVCERANVWGTFEPVCVLAERRSASHFSEVLLAIAIAIAPLFIKKKWKSNIETQNFIYAQKDNTIPI